jgi:hypothetical protein
MRMSLPQCCERALLERFLKAEAMALWAVRSAQLRDVPPNVQAFLRRHEQDEQDHLKQFESLLGRQSWGRAVLPSVPQAWPALAVQLFGYEALGLEFAFLLAEVRPDLSPILEDELTHVGFFEREIRTILSGSSKEAEQTRRFARTWWRKVPRTVDRYLRDDSFAPVRSALRQRILDSLYVRLTSAGLAFESRPHDGAAN